MQTAISRALSPSPTHSGSVDEFSYNAEISGDESDNEGSSTFKLDVSMDDEDDEIPSAKISRI